MNTRVQQQAVFTPLNFPQAIEQIVQDPGVLLTWYQRAHSRRQLATLESHRLNDIGISAMDAAAEARKPFWKD